MRIFDRYVLREILPPFFLSLLIFTFVLTLPPVMKQLEQLVAKGVTWGVAAKLILLLVEETNSGRMFLWHSELRKEPEERD